MYRQPLTKQMKNLSSHLLAISEVASEVFGEAIASVYVTTIWQNEVKFQLDYNRFVFANAMAKEGAVLSNHGQTFPVITFKHLDVKIEIVFS